MTRFAALTLLLVVICILLLCLALLIGRMQPIPDQVKRLHLTDCALPCWNTITPGITLDTDAKARISATLPRFQGPATSATANPDSNKFLIWTQYGDIDRVVWMVNVVLDSDHVKTIGIGTDYTSKEMPRLGETLVALGSPTCVTMDERSGFTSMYYEDTMHQFALGFSVFPLALETPVNNFEFGASNRMNCQNIFATSWGDFRRLQPGIFSLAGNGL